MNHKISELQTRYSLASKQSVYDRMKALQIIPVNRGEISSHALDELDKLDKFMKNSPGAKIWEFPRNAESLSTGQLDKSTGQINNFNETLQLVEVVEAIARHFATNQDPLAKYKALEYAANHVMLLPSSKIKELTGAKPNKNKFHGIFFISKTNLKIGREIAWKVEMANKTFIKAIELPTNGTDNRYVNRSR